MIVVIVTGCYGLAWLATARWLYARWRGRNVSPRQCPKHGTAEVRRRRYQPVPCCYDGGTASDGEHAAWAMVTSLAWPAVLLTAAVRYRPRPTQMEQREAREKLTARVAELENELGMKP